MKKKLLMILIVIISTIIMMVQPEAIRFGAGYNYFAWVQFLIIIVLVGIATITDCKTYKEKKEKNEEIIKKINDGTIKFGAKEREIYNEFKKEITSMLEKHNMKNIYLCGSELDILKKIMLYEDIKVCVQINKDKSCRDIYFLVKNTKKGPVVVDEDVFTNPDKYSTFHELSKEPAVQACGNTIYNYDANPNNYRNELSELLRSPQSWCWHVDEKVREEQEEQRRQDEERREEMYRRDREEEEDAYYDHVQEERDKWWDENVYHRS